ncbi:hypothetical protein JB92DRAFT_2826116 [Gautieria morchelliformis]|nr:hypothetical protein JB92DRAFT_2826116 [Gautieria morchelliformis]
MSQHNQGVRWVLGALALSLLLYMGSLGTGVFIVARNGCNVTAQDLGALFFCSLTDHLFLADTINTVFIILFDTLVVVVTLYNTLGLVRRSREFQTTPQKSLTQILAEQACGITNKALRSIAQHWRDSVNYAGLIHNSLMDEFGDLSIEEIGTSEAIEPHREDDPSSEAVMAIELEETPHGRELGSTVDTSSVAASMGEVSTEV